MEGNSTRRRLSKEAWVAISGIGAALITGAVTLLVHVIPAAQNSSAPTPGARPTATSASGVVTPTLGATSVGARMAGKWKGRARDSNGVTFQISLEIKADCVSGRVCGSIGVSHVPCYGQIFLESVSNDDVEFRVDNFDKRSNRAVCQPGAGEHFRLQPDGQLAYHTSYEPMAQGTLQRI